MEAKNERRGPHLGHLVAGALARHAHDPVLHINGADITGAQMAAQVSQFVQAFAELGAGDDATVGLLAANRPEVLVVIAAGQVSGARRTALHPLGSLDDHAYVLDNAGVTALIIDPLPAYVERARQLLERVPGLTQIWTLGPAEVGIDLIEVASRYQPVPLQVADLPADHISSLTYTGGTTGKPKGVIGTAGGLAAMTQVQLAEWEWPEKPTFLLCTPLSHAGSAFFAPTLMKGGRLVVTSKFDPGEVLRIIEEQRVGATMLVPSMLYALMDHPDVHKRDLSSLETIYYGAAPINPVRLAEAIELFGPILAQYYGQSECPMVISYLGRDDHVVDGRPAMSRLTSCGRPSAFLRTALLDDNGDPVAPGEPGEIHVAGPVLAGGYWQLPEQSAETFTGEWLRTGDVAREDEEGYWHIVDRTKDMIVSGGFNVFPREIEDVIAEHPAVAQVGVIGVPDDKWGEAVTAIVVLRDGGRHIDPQIAAEITASVKDRKGSVQAPKQILVTESLPLTALGKPDKKALRAQFWDSDRRVG